VAADSPDHHPLLVWAFAGFHVALLVALVVAVLYFVGLANDGLAALETWVGVVAYLYLWGVAWWTNRRMLDAVGRGLLTGTASPAGVLVEAAKWGGLAGFLAFLPALAVGIVLFVSAGGVEAVPIVPAGAAIGTVLSAGVGVLVGSGLALLDLLLLRLARAWLPVGPGPAGPADTGPAEP
jgi:hypothetical protein